jgi:hypothetical protein
VVVLLVCLFVVSRVVLLATGFSFETGPLKVATQNIDPSLMRTRLLESLWYMHGQPPLWNGLVGLSLNVFPNGWEELWHVIFLGLGLVAVLALYALLVQLGISRRAAAIVAAVFSLTPAVLAYENSFFYDYPTLVVLTVAAVAVGRFVSRPSVGVGLVVFGCAAGLVLLRTLFQVWWLLAVIALLLVACWDRRRTVLLACAVPLALVVSVYAKNWIMYGVPSTSSWAGMGLARVAVEGLSLSERRQLVSEGKLHPVSLVEPLSPLAAYEAVGIERDAPTGIPLLDEVSGPEYPANLENRTYIRISRLYWQDDLWIIRHRPGAYLRAVGAGLADFVSPPTRGWGGEGNVGRMSAYDRWFNEVAYGRLGLGTAGLFVVAAYLFALAVGLWVTVRRLRPGAPPATVTVGFALVTIVYVGVVGNLAEVGENYRFRFVVEPLAVALVAFGVNRLLERRSASLSASPPSERPAGGGSGR